MTVLQPLSERLKFAKLYVFADSRTVDDLPSFVREVVAGGADIVQVRLHGLTESRREKVFNEVRDANGDGHTILVVDSDLDVAANAGADALLLGHDDPAKARKRLHRWALVGSSVDAADGLRSAREAGVDFGLLGPVVSSHAGQPALVGEAVAAMPPADPSSLVWFADGGITPDNVELVLAAGARRIGVGSALAKASDPKAVAQALSAAVTAAWQRDPAMEKFRYANFDRKPQATFKQPPAAGLIPEVSDPAREACDLPHGPTNAAPDPFDQA